LAHLSTLGQRTADVRKNLQHLDVVQDSVAKSSPEFVRSPLASSAACLIRIWKSTWDQFPNIVKRHGAPFVGIPNATVNCRERLGIDLDGFFGRGKEIGLSGEAKPSLRNLGRLETRPTRSEAATKLFGADRPGLRHGLPRSLETLARTQCLC
jgi:hypothetical protein